MWAIFKSFVKDKKNALLGFTFGSIGFLEMYVALFPTFSTVAADKLQLLMQSYPKEIWTVIGVDPAKPIFTKIESFVAMEQFSIIWPILLVILAISLANAAVAGEIERGTAEFVISQPISRTKIFFSRYLAGLTILAVFVFASSYALVPLTKIHNIPLHAENILTVALSGFLFVWAVFSVAFLASTIFSEKGKSSFLTTGFVIISYVFNVIAGLKESLKNLQYFSVFHYYNSTTNFVDNKFVDNALWFFAGIAVVATIAALFRYTKRDIAV